MPSQALYTLAAGALWNVAPYNTNERTAIKDERKNKPFRYWSQVQGELHQ
jgi:hypothetical protein